LRLMGRLWYSGCPLYHQTNSLAGNTPSLCCKSMAVQIFIRRCDARLPRVSRLVSAGSTIDSGEVFPHLPRTNSDPFLILVREESTGHTSHECCRHHMGSLTEIRDSIYRPMQRLFASYTGRSCAAAPGAQSPTRLDNFQTYNVMKQPAYPPRDVQHSVALCAIGQDHLQRR